MASTKGQEKKKKANKRTNKKPKLHHHEEEKEEMEVERKSPGSSSNPNRSSGKRRRKNGMVTDPRFASVHSDPRFQRMPRKESKVPIDDRFAKVLTDKRFAESSAPVDKRGKPKSKKETNPMLHYYLQEEEEDEEKEKEKEEEEEEEEEEDEEEESDGLELEASSEEEEEEGGEISSSDEDDDDEDDDQDSVNSDVCHYLMAKHEDTPMTEQETYRLAVVNMDWNHIRAIDIYVVMSSCLPKGGQILSVAIYPTEFGLKCIEVEAVRGPSDLIDKNEDGSDDEQEIDDEKLRSYELNKLRYYYAVAVFDSRATANHIYNTLDGIELLRTSNVLDLRFIPDSMEFSHPPRDITTEAPTNYKQPDFETRALQHSKVNLTWEEDEPHRTKILRQKFNADKLDELNEYLATSESDDGEEEGNDTENEEVAALPNGESKKNMDREKLRALLLSENGSGSDEDDDKDMEITFNTGLEDLSKRILEKKDKKSETVWEQVLRKRSEKKKARRHSKHSSEDDSSDYDAEEVANQDDDFFMEDPSDHELGVGNGEKDLAKSKRAKGGKKGREKSPDIDKEQEASKAELELLFAEDQEGKDPGQKGYNMKLKKVKGKKGKEETADVKLPDVDPSEDPRFSALFTSHLFALDPTDPQYKRSAAYARRHTDKSKTSKKTVEEEETREPPEKGWKVSDDLVVPAKGRHELNSTVKSLKRNLKGLKKDPKAKAR